MAESLLEIRIKNTELQFADAAAIYVHPVRPLKVPQ